MGDDTDRLDDPEQDASRISKRDLIRSVAKRAGVPIRVAEKVYEALLVEVVDQIRSGTQVNFSGYGRFYPQVHKGHHAQFGASGKGPLPDYTVLKFSASRTLSDFLALSDEEARAIRVPGTTIFIDGAMSDDQS